MPPTALLDALRGALADRPEGPLLLALSGGEDSMALAGALLALRPAGRPVTAAHFDHAMHAGSAAIAAGLEAWARQQGLEWLSERAEAPLRTEAEARSARYAFLGRAADAAGARTVLTGHHQDDQAETVLLNLARGAGWRGAAGMPGSRELTPGVALVRPFLGLPRAELRAARAAWGLPFWEDPTNATAEPRRNRIRQDALPALRAHAPGASANLARFARLAGEIASEREESGHALAKKGVLGVGADVRRLDRQTLAGLRPADARAALWSVLAPWGLTSWPQLDEILDLCRSGRSGPASMLPGGCRVLVDPRAVWLVRPGPVPAPVPLPSPPFPARFAALGLLFGLAAGPSGATGARRAAIEAHEAGTWSFRVGRPRTDRFVGEAGCGLGGFLRRAGVPRALRDRVPVLARGSGVAWVPGLGAPTPSQMPGNPLELVLLADSTGLTNLFPPP